MASTLAYKCGSLGPPPGRSLRWQDHSTCIVRCCCCHRSSEAEQASPPDPGFPQQHGAVWKEAPVPRQVPGDLFVQYSGFELLIGSDF